MKNTKLSTLLAGAIACCMAAPAAAQKDTTRLDLGYLTLNRSFSQTITIKGEDLEKMPFASLEEAIAARAFGVFTTKVAMQYIVDGNPVSDPNVYSIHDIESVTLVLNAAALVGTGNGGQQQLAVIKTYRGKTPRGMTVAAQAGPMNGNNYAFKTYTNTFQNYYIGAWQNTEKWSAGVSASWLKDYSPAEKEGQRPSTPNNIQRWRLNGYFEWRPDAKNDIDGTFSYVPQKGGYGYNADDNNVLQNDTRQPFVLPRVKWTGSWLPGLTNSLEASWTRSDYRRHLHSVSPSAASNPETVITDEYDTARASHVWLRDRLSYVIHSRGWTIAPALDFSYHHLSDRIVDQINEREYYNGNGNVFYTSTQYVENKGHIMLLTPSVDLTYKKAFNLEGGALIDIGSNRVSALKKTLPFISGAVDLLHLNTDSGENTLKIYGSYAQRGILNDYTYQLADLFNDPVSSVLGTPVGGAGFPVYTGTNVVVPNVASPYRRFWVWEAGIGFSGLKGRFSVDYTFERRSLLTPGDSSYVYPGGYTSIQPYYAGFVSSLHHLHVSAVIFQTPVFKWESGVSLTLQRSKEDHEYGELLAYPMGNVVPDGYTLTGGLVNRVEYRMVSLGVDWLYHFNGRYYVTNLNGSREVVKTHYNSLPNLYVGYRPFASMEFFVESRNMVRSKDVDLLDPDYRRYYTVGGKFSL